jgi:hypothetical protein
MIFRERRAKVNPTKLSVHVCLRALLVALLARAASAQATPVSLAWDTCRFTLASGTPCAAGQTNIGGMANPCCITCFPGAACPGGGSSDIACSCLAGTASPPASASCHCAACADGQSVRPVSITVMTSYFSAENYVSTACLSDSTGQLPLPLPLPSTAPSSTPSPSRAPSTQPPKQEQPPSGDPKAVGIAFGVIFSLCFCAAMLCCEGRRGTKHEGAICTPMCVRRGLSRQRRRLERPSLQQRAPAVTPAARRGDDGDSTVDMSDTPSTSIPNPVFEHPLPSIGKLATHGADCRVCLGRPATRECSPCGHSVCDGCLAHVESSKQSCPICAARARDVGPSSE